MALSGVDVKKLRAFGAQADGFALFLLSERSVEGHQRYFTYAQVPLRIGHILRSSSAQNQNDELNLHRHEVVVLQVLHEIAGRPIPVKHGRGDRQVAT